MYVNHNDQNSLCAENLTLVFTTSPTPAVPSTELLTSVIRSFEKHCPFLLQCRVIVVLDTYDHVASTARLKRGRVTPYIADHFEAYKDSVKRLVLDKYTKSEEVLELSEAQAEYGSVGQPDNVVQLQISRTVDHKITFVEPLRRIGFGLAVRSALRLTSTEYVWVHQHDWTLVADIPSGDILCSMQWSDRDPLSVPVKYVCLPSIRMLEYAQQDHVVQFDTLRLLSDSLTCTFTTSPPLSASVPLTPMFYWHDKPHIVLTSHYLSRIFPSSLAMPRGAFIEDTVGQRARNQMKQGHWQEWATWLYYPDQGRKLCLRHLEGRTWTGEQGEAYKAQEWRAHNAKVADKQEVCKKNGSALEESDDIMDDCKELSCSDLPSLPST